MAFGNWKQFLPSSQKPSASTQPEKQSEDPALGLDGFDPHIGYNALAGYDPHGALDYGLDPAVFKTDMEKGLSYTPTINSSTKGLSIKNGLKGDDNKAVTDFLNLAPINNPGSRARVIAEHLSMGKKRNSVVGGVVDNTPGEPTVVDQLVKAQRAIFDGIMPAYPIELITNYLQSMQNQPKLQRASLDTLTPGQRAFAIGRGIGALVGGQGIGQGALDVMGMVDNQQAQFDQDFKEQTMNAQAIRDAAKAAMETGVDAWRTQSGLAGNFANTMAAQLGGLVRDDEKGKDKAALEVQKAEAVARRDAIKYQFQLRKADRAASAGFATKLVEAVLKGDVSVDSINDPEILAQLPEGAQALLSDPKFMADSNAKMAYLDKVKRAEYDKLIADINNKRALTAKAKVETQWIDDKAQADINLANARAQDALAKANNPQGSDPSGVKTLISMANSYISASKGAQTAMKQANDDVAEIQKRLMDVKNSLHMKGSDWNTLNAWADESAKDTVLNGKPRRNPPAGEQFSKLGATYTELVAAKELYYRSRKAFVSSDVGRDMVLDRIERLSNIEDQQAASEALSGKE